MDAVAVLRGIDTLLAFAELRHGPIKALQNVHARHGEIVVIKAPVKRGFEIRNIVLVANSRMAKAILQKPSDYKNMPLYPAKGPKTGAHRRLRNGILGMNGDAHRHFRRLLAPLLTLGAVEDIESRMARIAEAEIAAWPQGETVDLTKLVNRLSRRMSLELIFGETNLDLGLKVADAIEKHMILCTQSQASPFSLDVPGSVVRRLLVQAERTEALLLEWVHERRARPLGLDMMSAALSAKDQVGAPLDDSALAAQLWTLYGTSFETIAAALNWMLLLLAQHPRTSLRLLDDYRKTDTADASGLEADVLKEAMRLCTPVPLQARQVAHTLTLPHSSIELGEGDHVIISTCVINQSGKAFEGPLEFKPDRWSHDAASDAALLTFGAGPRACPGQRYSTAALSAALRAIWLKWSIRIQDGADIDYRVSITLTPQPVMVRLQAQTGAFRVAKVSGRGVAISPALAGEPAASVMAAA